MGDSDGSTLDSSAAVALTGKIMVISIIVLFVVVVFVVLLHVYARWFWWRIEEDQEDSTHPQRRRRQGRRFVFAPAGQQLTAARRGLDPTVLKSLPVRVFQAKDFEEGLECAVCLCELEEGEKARLLPKCNHGFHLECIDMWFKSHATCPICRNSVSADSSSGVDPDASFGLVEENLDGIREQESTESPDLPTNVLYWGDENELNSRNAAADADSSMNEGAAVASSSSVGAGKESMLVIDIPRQVMEELHCSELESPMGKRLRSLRRLLSGADRKANQSSNCGDVDAMP